MKFVAVGLAIGSVLAGGEAAAQDYVNARCRSVVTSARYDHADHSAWYRRFWTGQCGGLIFCQSGSPSWNEIVEELRSRAGPARADAVTRRACLLGQRIGFEWARDNNVRRIDTADLSRFVAIVQGSQDVEAGLSTVEQTVRSRLGR